MHQTFHFRRPDFCALKKKVSTNRHQPLRVARSVGVHFHVRTGAQIHCTTKWFHGRFCPMAANKTFTIVYFTPKMQETKSAGC